MITIAKKSKMEILMGIKAKVDKALPKSLKSIGNDMKNLKKDLKGLKAQEKLYSKQKALKEALKDNNVLYSKQKAELDKLSKAQDGNKKISEAQKKIYKEVKSEMTRLSRTIGSQESKLKNYDEQISKLPNSFEEVSKKMKIAEKDMKKFNSRALISQKIQNAKTKVKSGVKKGLGVAAKATAGVAIAGTLAVGSFGADSAKSYVEFNGQMKRVQALSRASTKDYNTMQDAAIKLGSTTSFTAKEAGEGMEFLALAGFKSNQIISAMPGLLDLAAASGEDLGSVADIVSDNLSAFGLQAKDAGHFADVMALASSSTNTTVGMLGEAFSYVAAPAKALGETVESTSAILGIMANNGIKASAGGTALRSALLNLASPTKAADAAITSLGLQTKDNHGKFIGMASVIKQLHSKFAGLTDVQQAAYAKAMFGKTAVSGMLSVINSAPDAIDKMTDALKHSDGAAKKMAKTILDGPNGALTLLSSAYDGVKISLGKKIMNDSTVAGIRKITSYISELANVINGSFSNDPVNLFWQKIFNETKIYIEKITKVIITIKNALQPIISFLWKHKDSILVFVGAFLTISTVIGVVSAVTGAILGLITTIASAGGIIGALGASMTALGGPIVWVIALLALLAYQTYKHWDDIKALFIMGKDFLFQTISDLFNLLPAPIQNFYMFFINIFINAFIKVMEIWENFKNGNISFVGAIVETFKAMPEAILEAFTNLFSLLKQKLVEVKNMIKLPKPPDWALNLITKVKTAVGVDGSHKNGLPNVPKDGYIAKLHKNERVLTAEENRDYTGNNGSSGSSGGIVFSPKITINIENNDNMEETINTIVQEKLKEALEEFKKILEGQNGNNSRTAF